MPVASGLPRIRQDLAAYGVVTQVISATSFVAAGLAGFGDGAFQSYAIYVLKKANNTTTPPHREQPACTTYVSSTGTFTHVAFTAPLAVGDEILLLHPNISTIVAAQVAKMAGAELDAVHAHANDVLWQMVFEFNPLTTRRKIRSIWLDFVNLTQSMNYRLRYQVDAANYRTFDSNVAAPWTIAMDDGVLIECNFVVAHPFILELQSLVLEGAGRNIPYNVFYEEME